MTTNYNEFTNKPRTIDDYIGKGFSNEQLDEIREGLADGLNVDVYADINMSAKQMMYVRKNLYTQKREYEKKQEELKRREDEIKKVDEELLEFKKRKEQRELAWISIVMFIIALILAIKMII